MASEATTIPMTEAEGAVYQGPLGPNLREALQKVWDSIAYITKTGRHTGAGGNFAYATESDVKREFHRLFNRHGLLMTLSEKALEVRQHTNKDGNTSGYLAIVTLKITLFHVATGESMSVNVSGVGYDSTDKAIGKAYSYAVKNWLLNSNLIETGQDVEQDENDEKLDRPMFTDLYEKALAGLKLVEPSKGEAKKWYFEALARYKTASKHDVEHPDQFTTREDAKQGLVLLRKMYTRWTAERFEQDSKSHTPRNPDKAEADEKAILGTPPVKKPGAKSKPAPLQVVEGDAIKEERDTEGDGLPMTQKWLKEHVTDAATLLAISLLHRGKFMKEFPDAQMLSDMLADRYTCTAQSLAKLKTDAEAFQGAK